MTLLAPFALLFAVAAGVPIVLHLWQQRKRTIVLFSTNRFFTASLVRSQRRMRLRRWLLLLLRVAACLMLAFALARPIMQLGGLGAGAGSRDVVILLDDSLSMQQSAGQTSQFERARQIATNTLNELASGDRAAVVTFTGRTIGRSTRGGLALSPDVPTVLRELQALQPGFGAGDLRQALAASVPLFEGGARRHRAAVIITDGQASDLRPGPWPEPSHDVTVSLVRLEPPTRRNISADQVVLSQGLAVVGQPNLLRARLFNHGAEPVKADLSLVVGGEEVVRRPIELPALSPHIEHIPLTFDAPGEHQLRLSLVPRAATADELKADNTLYGTVSVRERLPVLIVDGNPTRGLPRSGGFYLRAALLAVSPDGSSVQPDLISVSDLPAAALDSYRAVMLSNVAALPLREVERLESYVQSGGGLAIWLGTNCDRAFYNDILGGPSRPLGSLMPAELRSPVTSATQGNPMHIVHAELDHPVLQRFKGTLRSAVSSVSIYTAYGVVPREAWTVANLDEGLPLMLEKGFGSGRVLLVTTTPRPDLTNLPLRRVFIPLVHRITGRLAGGASADTGRIVQADMLVLDGRWNYDQPIHVVRPDGERVTAEVRLRGAAPVAVLPAAQVNQPGLYRVQLPSDLASQGAAAPPTTLAVNVPATESSPQLADLAELTAETGGWQVELIDQAAAASRAEFDAMLGTMLTGGQISRGIWDTLLWCVLALVLVEPLIANWRIGGRSSTGTSAPAQPATTSPAGDAGRDADSGKEAA